MRVTSAGGQGYAGGPDMETRDIATTRQLFLGNWIVDRTNGLERTLRQPEKKDLIQEADGRPWERGYVSWFVRDQKGLFHMRYRFLWWDASSRASVAKSPAEQFRRLFGYAVSDDGIRWRKPVLERVEGPTGFRPAPKSKWKEGAFLEPIWFSKQNSFGYPIEMVTAEENQVCSQFVFCRFLPSQGGRHSGDLLPRRGMR